MANVCAAPSAARANETIMDLVFIDLIWLNGFSVEAPMKSGSEAASRVLKDDATMSLAALAERAVSKRTEMFAFIVAKAVARAKASPQCDLGRISKARRMHGIRLWSHSQISITVAADVRRL